MFSNLALTLLIVFSVLGLAGCGATDSGHADGQSATTSSTDPVPGSGGTNAVPPVITEQPVSQSVYQDENISVSVVASGSELQYRWEKAIDNAWIDLRQSEATLSFRYITIPDSGLYRVEISNDAGSIFSDAIEINVKEKLNIVEHPENGERNEGASVDFVVDVAGEPPYHYQWYRNSTALSEGSKFVGTQTDHLVVNALTTSDAGNYSVVITNDDGQQIESDDASLVVNGPVAITSQPADRVINEGEAANLVVWAGGTRPISYQWQKNSGAGWANVEGATYSALRISSAKPSDAAEYRCIVDNPYGAAVISDSATVSIVSPVTITSQPANAFGSSHRVSEGASVSYSVTATGTDVSYEWLKNGVSVHEGSSLNLGSVNLADAGTYQCLAKNAMGTVECNSVSLVVLSPVSISQHPESKTLVAGQSGSISVSATGTAPFSYQWQKSSASGWQNISGASSSTLSFGSVNSSDAGDYRVIVNNEVGQAATSVVASVGVIETVAITQQPVDVYGSEYRGVVGESISLSVSASGTDVSYVWYKDGEVVGRSASLSLSGIGVSDAGIYRCEVSNSEGSLQCSPFELVILTPPAIVSQSSGVSVFEDANVAFQVQVSGSPVPAIQWFKDGAPLAGQTSATLYLGGAELDEEGSYTCEVSNEAGSASCAPIALEVKEIVRITSSPSNQVLSGGETASLSVTATGEAPLTYTWYKDGDVYQSGVNLTSISLSNVDASDEGSYHVAVSNEGSGATSAAAVISVFVSASGSAVISWAAPVEREDGDDLNGSEIRGYKVYCRLADGSFEEVAYVTDANSVEINDLELGTHYFAVTTVDTNNMESGMSSVVAVEISN